MSKFTFLLFFLGLWFLWSFKLYLNRPKTNLDQIHFDMEPCNFPLTYEQQIDIDNAKDFVAVYETHPGGENFHICTKMKAILQFTLPQRPAKFCVAQYKPYFTRLGGFELMLLDTSTLDSIFLQFLTEEKLDGFNYKADVDLENCKVQLPAGNGVLFVVPQNVKQENEKIEKKKEKPFEKFHSPK